MLKVYLQSTCPNLLTGCLEPSLVSQMSPVPLQVAIMRFLKSAKSTGELERNQHNNIVPCFERPVDSAFIETGMTLFELLLCSQGGKLGSLLTFFLCS